MSLKFTVTTVFISNHSIITVILRIVLWPHQLISKRTTFGSGAPRNTLSDMPTLKTNFINAVGSQQFLFFTEVTRIDKNGFLSPQERTAKDVECVMDALVMTARNVASVWISLSKGGSGKMKKCCTKRQCS